MVKKRRPKKRNSSKSSRSRYKRIRKMSSCSSEVSPFKGFAEILQPESVSQTCNNAEKLDNDALFDKLLNDGFQHHFNKNRKTYYNKKKDEINNSPLLDFNDCRNRTKIIKWLNDTRNIFSQLTQSSSISPLQEYEATCLDFASGSQENKFDTSTRRSHRYKARAKSLDVEVKKNETIVGDTKRRSSTDNCSDIGCYNIENMNANEEIPIHTKKKAFHIIDLIEDEYLDNIDKEIMQQDERKMSDWKRIKDFNKSIGMKKPKQLKVKVEECLQKDLLINNRTYDYKLLENYFVENMQKLIDDKKDRPSAESLLLISTIRSGQNFLSLLKTIKENYAANLKECQPLLGEIKEVFVDFFRGIGIQASPSFNSIQTQTLTNVINSSTQTESIGIKIDKFIQTDVTEKSTVNLQQEKENESKQEFFFDDDLDFNFNTEDFNPKVEVEKSQIDQYKDVVPLVSNEIIVNSNGKKRIMLESPEPHRKTSKRPCSSFINDNLSVVFSTCPQDDQQTHFSQLSEHGDDDLDMISNKFISENKTQRQIEEAMKSEFEEEIKFESGIVIKASNTFRELEKAQNFFTTNENIVSANKIKKTSKTNSPRNLFQTKQYDTFLNTSFNNDKDETVIKDKTIQEKKLCKVTVLENVVLKSGIDKQGNFSDEDFVDSTPRKSFHYREESQLDVTLPPPLQFQDNEKNELVATPRRPFAIINKMTSTPVSRKPESEYFPTLSPISNDESQKYSQNNTKNLENKKSAATYEFNKFSPLNIEKNQQDHFSSTSKQRTILNYVKRPSQENVSQILQSSFDSNKTKPCIACSRISKEQILAICSLTRRKLATYTTSFTSKVTHLIVSVTEKNCLKDHTMKFILAVASGIWVLNFTWIEECLKKNAIVPEEPFEVFDVSGNPGPKNSRLLRVKKPLFKGYTIYPAPPFTLTTQQEIENAIQLLGGEVASCPETLIDKCGNICLIVAEGRASQDFELYDTWLDALNVITVDREWLSQSIGQYQVLNFRPFTLCSDDNLENLAYPPELIENTCSLEQISNTVSSLS